MKFIVSSTALSSHLQAISRVINSKNALPILDCFLFELQDGTLSVTVSDSETTMVTTVEVNESDADGRFAVTAKTLLDALKEIPEQPLTFDINTSSLEITVQYQNGKYSLMGQNADEFPQSAMLGENAVRVEMDAQVLLGGINRAVFATADDELRPVMNGIYFDITTEDITMVASDGHKLVRCKTLAAKGNERAAFILPKKPAQLYAQPRNNGAHRKHRKGRQSQPDDYYGRCVRYFQPAFPLVHGRNSVQYALRVLFLQIFRRYRLAQCCHSAARIQCIRQTNIPIAEREARSPQPPLCHADPASRKIEVHRPHGSGQPSDSLEPYGRTFIASTDADELIRRLCPAGQREQLQAENAGNYPAPLAGSLGQYRVYVSGRPFTGRLLYGNRHAGMGRKVLWR